MKSLIQKVTYSLSGMMMAGVVYAQDTVNLGPTEEFANLSQVTLPNIVPVVIQMILIVAALVALVFLIVGGIKWITSGGDKTAVESARGTITSALIGLLIVFAAWAIIRLIEYFFGLAILDLKVPTIELTGD